MYIFIAGISKPYLRTSAIVSSSGEIAWALLKSATAA
jgi:hypothetical protein